MKKIISFGIVLGAMTPLFVFGEVAANPNSNGLFGILAIFDFLIKTVLPILIGFAAVWFVYNVIRYTITADEEGKKDAKKGIISGLIGLFIIVAFWGIIGIFKNTFGVDSNLGESVVPCIPSVENDYTC